MADKKKIYLFCSAGMSTSMMAQSMQTVADEKNLGVEVKAFPVGKVDEICEAEHPICCLLGPQSSYVFEETKKRVEATFDIPVGLMEQQAYGMMDGEACLKQAVKLIKSYKK